MTTLATANGVVIAESRIIHLIPADKLKDSIPGVLVADAKIRVEGYTGSFSLGISPEGTAAREVFGGPLVERLFGWLMGDCTIIDGGMIPDERETYDVKPGELIEVETVGTFKVVKGNKLIGEYSPKLEVVK